MVLHPDLQSMKTCFGSKQYVELSMTRILAVALIATFAWSLYQIHEITVSCQNIDYVSVAKL